jgi:hypothetical protein
VLAKRFLDERLFDLASLVQLGIHLFTKGKESTYPLTAEKGPLTPDLIDQLAATKAKYETMAADVEQLQLADYLADRLMREHSIDRNNSFQIARLLKANQLEDARAYLNEIGQDEVIADEMLALLSKYRNYAATEGKLTKQATFLAEEIYADNLSARQRLIKLVLQGDMLLAGSLVDETPGLPTETI